jgi:hypothetical protein
MQVAGPIHDEQGALRGALALIINPDMEFTMGHLESVKQWGWHGLSYKHDPRGDSSAAIVPANSACLFGSAKGFANGCGTPFRRWPA